MPKGLLDQVLPDVRFRQAINELLKPVLTELIARNRQRRAELAKQPPCSARRHLPNPEKPENVVYPVRLKVVCHPAQPITPPLVPILLHVRPIIGGKAPVLAHFSVIIRGCASFFVHVEKLRRVPRIYGVMVDANWQVALEHHAHFRGILRHFKHLHMQQILDIVVESDAFVKIRFRRRQRCKPCWGHHSRAEVPPPIGVGRAKEVTEIAKKTIGPQPKLSLTPEFLEPLRIKSLLALFGEHGFQQIQLCHHHIRKIDWIRDLQIEIGVPLFFLVVKRIVKNLDFFVDFGL
mmetsp:Transcript_6069/g.5351  ORF Transcript_6069/g.5351 Transcript_6069/m.5351 type:complete len:291 (+) Transcript_6069:1121-1993(+)